MSEYIFVTNIFEYSNIRIYSSHSAVDCSTRFPKPVVSNQSPNQLLLEPNWTCPDFRDKNMHQVHRHTCSLRQNILKMHRDTCSLCGYSQAAAVNMSAVHFCFKFGPPLPWPKSMCLGETSQSHFVKPSQFSRYNFTCRNCKRLLFW